MVEYLLDSLLSALAHQRHGRLAGAGQQEYAVAHRARHRPALVAELLAGIPDLPGRGYPVGIEQ
jgi:hypothetical protein